MEGQRSFSTGSSLGMATERTESFMAKLAILNEDMAAADEALKALNKDILSYVSKKEREEAEWLENEERWKEELEELRAAAGTPPSDEEDYAEKQYWTTSREWRDIIYGGCYLSQADSSATATAAGTASSSSSTAAVGNGKSKPKSGFNSIEAILEQKHFKNKLYYKVKWAGADVVSWEEADELKMIGALDHAFASMTPARRKGKLRPAIYIPRRVAASSKCGKYEDERKYPGLWTCEVEPMVWVPYDTALQQVIEKAFQSRNTSVLIRINNFEYHINFDRLVQTGGRSDRPVKRIEQIPDEVVRGQINEMTLQQLRDYLSTVVEFTPVHYEALARLHEEDKVRTHLNTKEIASLPSLTFAEMMEEICNGATYSAFSTECSICLEDYKGTDHLVCMPSCGHTFHRACAVEYFSRFSKLCPYCKESVV